MSRQSPTATSLLADGFDRVRDLVGGVVDGLDPDALGWRPDGTGNSIGWLVWHLTRIQDDHLADAAGAAQVWTELGWADRFGLPFDLAETGYAMESSDVDRVRVDSPDLLREYHEATHRQTLEHLHGWDDASLARVVDGRWDPPVTLAVRLVSVLSDDLQHVDQAAYVRGLRPSS